MSAALDIYPWLAPDHPARSSAPTLTGFNPDVIPMQRSVIDLIRRDHDYVKDGTLEILLSGSVGSTKSVLIAHIIVTHCLQNKRANFGIVRRSRPDLRETLFSEILEHLSTPSPWEDEPKLKEGRDYWVDNTRCRIRFRNGSKITPITWADRKYKKPRSLKLSGLAIEEAVENDHRDEEGFLEARDRVGRLPHVKENLVIMATNPGEPSHWIARRFITPPGGRAAFPNRHVFYSLTKDNPWLSPNYIRDLRRGMDPKRARRMLDGEWIELESNRVYHAYADAENTVHGDYLVEPSQPIYLSWDFNIGVGKPLSMICFQYIDDVFHFFNEVTIEGIQTIQSCEELAARGVLDIRAPIFYVCGDATGKRRDTRSKSSDYDIIMKFLQNYEQKGGGYLNAESLVPRSNPAVRTRHNTVNAYCHNALEERRLYIYGRCPMAQEGMRLVKLKEGSQYIEDDTPAYQHVTTAIGYGVCTALDHANQQTGTSTRY